MTWDELKIDVSVLEGIAPVAMLDPDTEAFDPHLVTPAQSDEAKAYVRSRLLDMSTSAIERSGVPFATILDQIADSSEMTEDVQRALSYAFLCRWYSQQRWTDEDRYQADSEAACEEAHRLIGVLARYWPQVLGYTEKARGVWAL